MKKKNVNRVKNRQFHDQKSNFNFNYIEDHQRLCCPCIFGCLKYKDFFTLMYVKSIIFFCNLHMQNLSRKLLNQNKRKCK